MLNVLRPAAPSMGDNVIAQAASTSYSSPMPIGLRLSARTRTKREVVDAYIRTLEERGDVDTHAPGFYEGIQAHFDRLPTRYALDVNINSLDVLSHKELLDAARRDPAHISFSVRVIDPRRREPGLTCGSIGTHQQAAWSSKAPLPAFGSSPNLQALALEAGENAAEDGQPASFYEITLASSDQPKLLSRLSEALGDIGLNIREAHAFNTDDGYSLDVFVADEYVEQPGRTLEELLGERLAQMPPPRGSGPAPAARHVPALSSGMLRLPEEPLPHPLSLLQQVSPPLDDWEIDISQLQVDAKIASGAFSNLYRGLYCGQEVAVKILKDVQDDSSQYQEFLQEVSIMRKVRHKNVVQFIGACTRKPNLCIVFEFMTGGSLYDYMRREGFLQLTQVFKVAADIARGMDYLHQRRIIHRDLKAANLLMDDHNIVKIADFGVARVIEASGNMTAETGTYRWMAPEVIEHRPYDEKADVYSFAIVVWELLTCRVPYSDMTPLQAAVGVVQKHLRPDLPPTTPPALAMLIEACWEQEAAHRPSFRDLTPRLQQMLEAAREEESRKAAVAALAAAKPAHGGGLLSKLRGKG